MLNILKEQLNPYFDKPWIVSVSTGVDSMVLFDLVRQLNHQIVIVHFNHQKREASVHEAAFLRDYCVKLNIHFEYFILDIQGHNFQDQAHQMRKQYLEQVAKKYQTPYILTAHHLNDLAETILMKISRGSNLMGYAGFQSVSKQGDFIYLKPLLTLPKSMLYEYAKTNQIHYFEDSSNTSNDYTRNRYRQDIIPAMMSENPQFLSKTIQYSNQLYEAFSYIREQTNEYLNSHQNRIQLSTFFLEHSAVQKDIIAHLLELHDISFNQLKIMSILSFLKESGPNQTFPLTETLVMKRVYQKAYITTIRPFKAFRQELDLEAFNVLETMGFVTFLDAPSNSSFYEIKLCYNKLALPLVARSREPGDILEFSFGKKKLKDYYIDHKIPLDIRDRDIIISDQTGRILSVLGRYYNVSPDLNSHIKLRYKRGY